MKGKKAGKANEQERRKGREKKREEEERRKIGERMSAHPESRRA